MFFCLALLRAYRAMYVRSASTLENFQGDSHGTGNTSSILGMDEPWVAKLCGASKSKPRPQPNDGAGLGGPRRGLEVAECREAGPPQKKGR